MNHVYRGVAGFWKVEANLGSKVDRVDERELEWWERRERRGGEEANGYSRLRTSNPSELAFIGRNGKAGARIIKRGWPDFLLTRPDGSMAAVEVKPGIFGATGGASERLKYEQTAVMVILAGLGLECLVSDGIREEPFVLRDHGSRRFLDERGGHEQVMRAVAEGRAGLALLGIMGSARPALGP